MPTFPAGWHRKWPIAFVKQGPSTPSASRATRCNTSCAVFKTNLPPNLNFDRASIGPIGQSEDSPSAVSNIPGDGGPHCPQQIREIAVIRQRVSPLFDTVVSSSRQKIEVLGTDQNTTEIDGTI